MPTFFDRTITIQYDETPSAPVPTSSSPTGVVSTLPPAAISLRTAFPTLAAILDGPSFAAIGQNIDTLGSKINFFKVFSDYGSSDENAQRVIANMIINDQNPETGLPLSLDPYNTRRIGEVTPDYDYSPDYKKPDFSKIETAANIGLGLANTYFLGGGLKGVIESLFTMLSMAPAKTVNPSYQK